MKIALLLTTISLASCASQKPPVKYDKTILLVVKSQPSLTGLLIETAKLIIP